MENFFIVFLLIASALYKVYTNYQKEVESTRKRLEKARMPKYNETQPPVNQDRHSYQNPKPYMTIQEFEKDDTPEEVKKIQDIKRLTTIKLKDKEEENLLTKQSFDLRQAVIQSIILERPYK